LQYTREEVTKFNNIQTQMFVKEKLKLFDELDEEKFKTQKEVIRDLLVNPPDDLISFLETVIAVPEQPFYSTRSIFP
jgi:hypothetical protein